MKSKVIDANGQKTVALIFEIGDEVMSGLENYAKAHQLTASQFTAIGAFSEAELAFFDWDSRGYQKIPVGEQMEVLSLLGDISLHEGKPKVHAHVVVGLRDGSTRGGHLMSARVRPTLEVVLIESPQHLRRRHDPKSGLSLIDLESE